MCPRGASVRTSGFSVGSRTQASRLTHARPEPARYPPIARRASKADGPRCTGRPAQHHQRRQRDAQAAGYGKSAKIAPRNSRSPSALIAALDLAARRLDERRILHAGRTGGDARHAAETRVEVAHERRRHLGAAVEPALHQIDASARRIHLLAPQHVGRTRRQAEAAVHARVDQRWIRRVDAVERGLAASQRVPGPR